MTRVLRVGISTLAVLVASTAVQAQTLLAADEIRGAPPPEESLVIGRGPYAAVPPPGVYGGRGDETIPPFEIARMLRASGFEPLGAPVRRRFVYTISAIDPEGYDGRVVVDAHTGRIMRFIPAEAVDDMAEAYGPAGFPPPPPIVSTRPGLRPPAASPRIAGRPAPPAVVKPEPRRIEAPRPQQSAAVQPSDATSDRGKAGAAVAARPAPVIAGTPPASVQLQPTQAMPPVQGLE